MGNPEAVFDSDLFARTASRFVMKRSAFPQTAVAALAGDVLHRLAGPAAARASQDDPPEIREEDVVAFCAALTQPGPEAALRFIEARRAEGLTRVGVYMGYICAAARRLGEGWERDEYSFLDVTTGTGHLYALMRALRAETPGGPAADSWRHALFATVPGEDHSIGITVAADMFRERGWDIDLVTGCGHDALIARVERSAPRVIGLSLSSEARLNALARLVVGMRFAAPRAIIGVAPADGLDGHKVTELVDIDLLFTGAVSALSDLEAMAAPQG